MKTKSVIKIILDTAMLILFTILTFGFGTSNLFHELAGIGIGVMYIVHLILNHAWIKSLFTNKLKPTCKNFFNIATDLLMLLGMSFIIITGIMISISLFDFHPDNFSFILTLHTISSYICMGVLAIHILLHLKYLLGMFKNIFRNRAKKAVVMAYSMSAAIVFACILAYRIYGSSSKLPDSAALKGNSYSETTTSTTIQTEDTPPQKNNSDSNITQSETQQTITSTTPLTTPPVTLQEYLSKLYCNGCGRHCPLSNPRCRRSQQYIEQATTDYNETYNVSN